MKRKIIIITILLLFIAISILAIFLYKDYRIKHEEKIVVLYTDEIEVFSKVKLKDLIKSINGNLVKNKKINTTHIGKQKIKFEYITDNKIKVPYEFSINIVDKISPVISKPNRISTQLGNNNFGKNLFCGDNYDNKPKCYFEGEYDINTPGEYEIKFIGEDSSKNRTEHNLLLNVYEPVEKNENKEDIEKEETYTYFQDIVNKYKSENTKIGIDISQFQGDIDFEKIKEAGVEFAYIRVGRGGGVGNEPVLDKKFENNIKGLNKAGIPVGVYFFSYAINEKEAKKDAKWVLEQIKKYKIDLEIVYDFEDWKDFSEYEMSFYKLTETAKSFNNYMKKNGYEGMLYSSKYYLENIWFKQEYPVWLAHYTEQTNYEGNYKVWQICEDGKIDGINSKVDIDIMYN